MSEPDPTLVNQAQDALAKVSTDWISRSGVIAVEVARRWRDGAPTNDVGIRVIVERKLPPDEVPEGELFPGSLEGIPVDIVEGHPPQLES
ncbi:MAG TPA: hypothetical protein VFS66_11305 [Acidimicrobiia bacterium]|nr:hypothetical protein [Acidimicrobiia bacterium]